jgi:hypothetical protein
VLFVGLGLTLSSHCCQRQKQSHMWGMDDASCESNKANVEATITRRYGAAIGQHGTTGGKSQEGEEGWKTGARSGGMVLEIGGVGCSGSLGGGGGLVGRQSAGDKLGLEHSNETSVGNPLAGNPLASPSPSPTHHSSARNPAVFRCATSRCSGSSSSISSISSNARRMSHEMQRLHMCSSPIGERGKSGGSGRMMGRAPIRVGRIERMVGGENTNRLMDYSVRLGGVSGVAVAPSPRMDSQPHPLALTVPMRRQKTA